MDDPDLRQDLEAMRTLVGGMSPQERGRRFERWLKDLLNARSLDAVGSYRPRGEKIDGSFVLDHRVMLYEAKWPADSLAASSIYAFKGKVDGKLVGTVGVYISMAGFDPATIDALEKGKDLNVILVDDEDLDVALDVGIDAVLRTKLRAAAERGAVHFPVRSHEVTTTADRVLPVASISMATRRFVVVVEGRLDRIIVARFASRLLREIEPSPKELRDLLLPEFGVDVIASSGFSALPGTAAAVRDAVAATEPLAVVGMAIVADGDYEDEGQRRLELAADERIRDLDVEVIVAQPSVATAWLDVEPPDLTRLDPYLARIDQLDLQELRARQSSFDQFARALTEAAARPGRT